MGEKAFLYSLIHVIKMDWLLFACLFFLWLFFKFTPHIVRTFLNLVGLIITTWYIIDVISLKATDQRLSLEGIKFGWEFIRGVPLLIPYNFLAISCGLVFITFLFAKITQVITSAFILLGLLAGIFINIKKSESRYCFDIDYIKDLFGKETAKVQDDYPADVVQASRYALDVENINSEKIPHHIVIITLESFSSTFSKLFSGLSNSLPLFDELALKGTAFPNTLANSLNSNYGMTALLAGVTPIGSPRKENNPYYIIDSYTSKSRVLKRLQEAGWLLEIFSAFSTTTATVRRDSLLSFGMQTARFPPDWSGEIKDLSPSVEITPEEEIFGAALHRIKELQSRDIKYLLTIETGLGHKVWGMRDLSKPRAKDLEILRYISLQLQLLIKSLEEIGYFNDGLLIITSDHRTPCPIVPVETERFGDSAPYRIPLIIIGQNIPRGAIDNRFVQQADLLPHLADIINSAGALPDFIVVPGQARTPFINVFDLAVDPLARKAYRARLEGRNIQWEEKIPQRKTLIENYIHKMRSAYQDKNWWKK